MTTITESEKNVMLKTQLESNVLHAANTAQNSSPKELFTEIEKQSCPALVAPTVYREEETIVGTWMGEILYRYCLERNVNGASYFPLPTRIKQLVRMSGRIHRSDGYDFPIPVYQNSSDYVVCTVSNNTFNYDPHGRFLASSFSVILEYTKTTDTLQED